MKIKITSLYLIVALFVSLALGLKSSYGESDISNPVADLSIELVAPVESLIYEKSNCPTLLFEALSKGGPVELNGFDENLFIIDFKIYLDSDDGSGGLTIANRSYPLDNAGGNHGRIKGITINNELELSVCSLKEKLLWGLRKVYKNGSFDARKVKSAKCRIGFINPSSDVSTDKRVVLYTNYYSYDRDEVMALISHVTKYPATITDGVKIKPSIEIQ